MMLYCCHRSSHTGENSGQVLSYRLDGIILATRTWYLIVGWELNIL